jgi:Tfp pilus assembly protein PilV
MRAQTQRRRRRGEHGIGLVETLAAFLLLFIVTLAVLQLFSMAAAVNLGALARTDLSYRAERTLEVIRIQDALKRLATPANNSTCCPLNAGTNTLPVDSTNCLTFWGSGGYNVWSPGAPYTISYTVGVVAADANDSSIGGTEVAVTATPNTTGSTQYLGAVALVKAVRYVAKLDP